MIIIIFNFYFCKMKIFYDLKNINIQNPAITIGSFDGLHLGHEKIIKHLKKKSQKISGKSVIFTFLEHPRKVLFPEQKFGLLHTNNEKIEKLKQLGIDYLILFNFTKEIANLNADEFIKQILVDKIGIKSLIVGFNHSFGKNRLGNIENIKKLSILYNFSVEKVEALLVENIKISSSVIRKLIELGDIITANKYLGYNYTISGIVISGKKIGRAIGFPTANISVSKNKLIPTNGVYAVDVKIKNKLYAGMLNIGYRPTLKENIQKKQIEVHILNFNEDIYNKEISIIFKKKIRDEIKFNNIQELKKQLWADKKNVELF